jgi:hypothetical protein
LKFRIWVGLASLPIQPAPRWDSGKQKRLEGVELGKTRSIT